MNTRTAATGALLALAALTASCSSDSDTTASPAACKEALAEQLQEAMDNGTKGTQPVACMGLGSKTLKDLADEVATEWMKSGDADKIATDALRDAFGDGIPVPDVTLSEPAPPEIPADCLAYLKDELQDSTNDIDATAGLGACGDLSDEEMDQAVEEATNDLIEQGVDTP